MKPFIMALCFLTTPLLGEPRLREMIICNIQIADELLDELSEEGICYYFDEQGNLHVILGVEESEEKDLVWKHDQYAM